MIDAVAIRRFKRIRDSKIGLEPVTVVVGANNSGKTSLLQALQFSAATAQSAKLFGGAEWTDETFECVVPVDRLIYTPSQDVAGLLGGGVAEIALSGDGLQCTVSVSSVELRGVRVKICGRALGEQLQGISPPFSIYAPGLAGISRAEESLPVGILNRRVARGDANLVLRNVLHRLFQDRAAWPRFLEAMSAVLGQIDIRVRFLQESDEHIQVEFSLAGGEWHPIDAAGNGVLQTAQMLAYVELFSPRMLILDEPDSHLHPDNQKRLVRVLISLARERDIQVILGTHSRHVLDSAHNEAKVVWLSGGAVVTSEDNQLTAMLLDLGALDSADYAVKQAPRCVVATEDTDVQLLESLLLANGFQMSETHILSYSGCSQLNAALVLGSYLRERVPGATLVVHRDRDYMVSADVDAIDAALKKDKIHLFVTPGNDIEHSFLNEQHLSAASGVDEAVVVEQLEAARVDTKDKSVRRIVNHRTDFAYEKRRKGGDSIDHGDIAILAHRDYAADPKAMCHGKTVLAQVKASLQRTKGDHFQVTRMSPHLRIERLAEIARAVWPGTLPR